MRHLKTYEGVSNINWLEMASEFTINKQERIKIKEREQIDGSIKWVVYKDGSVMTKEAPGYFISEPFPSNRTEEFVKNTRFDTKEEAYDFYDQNKQVNKYNL